MTFRRRYRLVGVLAGVCVLGCSGSGPEVVEQPYTFLGIAAEVETPDDYRVGPAAYSPGTAGGGDFTVGPAQVVLEDGTQLAIPTGTPGGNACEGLYDPDSMDLREGEYAEPWDEMTGPKPVDCVLIGATDSDGRVEWFQVLDRQRADTGLVHVGHVVDAADEDTALVSEGYRIPLADDVRLSCPLEPYEDIAQLVEERPGLQEALLDPHTGEIVEVACIYRD